MSAHDSTVRAFALFGAAYPTARKVDRTTIEVWAEALATRPSRAIDEAARHWINTESRFPSLASFIECVRAQHQFDDQSEPEFCGTCENGWVETDGAGRSTVTRCPNGCLPAPYAAMEERPQGQSTAGPDVIAMLRATQQAQQARRREIGDRAYIAEQGYDPDRYEMKRGCLQWIPPPETPFQARRRRALERGKRY